MSLDGHQDDGDFAEATSPQVDLRPAEANQGGRQEDGQEGPGQEGRRSKDRSEASINQEGRGS